MSNVNPYQSPASPTTNQVEFARVAKSFSYNNSELGKGVIFTGTIVAGRDGLFVSHDKHSWKTAVTWTAALGLLGAFIHAMITRNKKFDYPYPVLPSEELPDSIRTAFEGYKFKPKSMISVIPREQVESYQNGMMQKKFNLNDDVEITLLSSVGKGMKKLAELGYESKK